MDATSDPEATMAATMKGMRNRNGRRKRLRSRAAFLVGAGSLFDLRGQTTYQSMRRLMPPTPTTTLHHTYRAAAHSLTPPSSHN